MTPANGLLLVEGKDDMHVIIHLLRRHNYTELPFTITPVGGIDNITGELRIKLKIKDDMRPERIGVIVDADTDLAARWQSLCATLEKAGYTDIPDNPNPDGTIIQQPGFSTVGIWLMPDNKLPGMLEDFIAFLVPAGDALWAQATACVQQIAAEQRRFSNSSKADIHTWLAWQEEPGTPLGQAITARYLDARTDYAHKLVDWVKGLFPN